MPSKISGGIFYASFFVIPHCIFFTVKSQWIGYIVINLKSSRIQQLKMSFQSNPIQCIIQVKLPKQLIVRRNRKK
jgi:tRNA uridine 5-carbamoylmethylation protein Kti12